ncbi:hypothetical protein Q4561_05510 [Alteromonas sp. 1_MG-2023]|uniref:hypothetical protein n=1 Tax=Alteromonas sp. 1_MG-2023 TaxID=3062669 RepID=UPI0026E46564|nr:hypothetical protein [Alteromonas sp. 1_MG-2023]MDO6566506.1 hypothetical protein [Alteromonas sp. 1_MG-2023]
MTKLNSDEIKAILKISDCQLMHLRSEGGIEFEKQGRSYLYSIPSEYSLLDHPSGKELINWHTNKHSFEQSNKPIAEDSRAALESMVHQILMPLKRQLGTPSITYGFTSFALKSYVQKFSSSGTAPSLDQHSAYEKNSAGKQICSRGGAACDFYIKGVPTSDIVRLIVNQFNFDRIYYYGDDRPLHVSIHLTDPQQHLQLMNVSENGRRYPSKRAYGEQAKQLAEQI